MQSALLWMGAATARSADCHITLKIDRGRKEGYLEHKGSFEGLAVCSVNIIGQAGFTNLQLQEQRSVCAADYSLHAICGVLLAWTLSCSMQPPTRFMQRCEGAARTNLLQVCVEE
jgi:hypothetical protein